MQHFRLVVVLCLAMAWQAGARAEESLSEQLIKATQPILHYALDLIGAPYKFGGSDPEKGMDCSGYVRHVYKQAADVDLPRNAKAISEKGTVVDNSDLKPGDLVFFNTMRKAFSHVGIYAGNDKFVHAASTRTGAVMVSDMKEGYWAKRYNGARRILSTDATDK
jgi:cell wall-associated NlpC family hydrolase